ncbi:MAG: phosphoribosylaminoimidazolesuccinocarboxamide synthase [Thermodesulfobacteriota bacterium]
MNQNDVVMETNFIEAGEPKRGKVRDIYDLGDSLLLVVSDRISAYDVIMNEGIPGKGVVLNQISKYWFDQTTDIIKNHLISTGISDYPHMFHKYDHILEGRSMLVKKTKPLAIECVVRGYVAGSGWKEYQESRSICGIELPDGILESGKLDEPIFTPATKAELGDHDENITFERAAQIVGQDIAERVRNISIALYIKARNIADDKGIIIADTKFEFGIDENDELILIDEALTPDSSRFWPKDEYEPGRSQKSYDKQFVRDFLTSTGWDKTPPPPTLPQDVIQATSEKYKEAFYKLAKDL